MADSTVPAGLLAGRLEGVSLPDLLWGLSERGCTGVLRVERDAVVKTLTIDGGRIVFASSSDPNDRLGELLLRRGAITIGQLEAALLQQETGKRLGTLLVEDGSLSPEALVEAVLEQVAAIALDLVAWDEGEYRFEEGPPPGEEITLSRSTADLVLAGVRDSRSFTRIRRGVGVGRTVYGLCDGWRERVEALELTDDERAVLVRLEEGPASVDALCGDVLLSNFDTYRTLWAFRILGLVVPQDAVAPVADAAREVGPLGPEGFPGVLVRLARSGRDGVLYVSRKGAERSFHLSGGRCVFATSNDPDDALMASALRRGVISLRDREETARRLLSNKRVGEILLELGVIDRDDLLELVQAQLGEIVFDTFSWTSGEYAFVPGELPSSERITLDGTLESLVADGVARVRSWTQVVLGCGGIDNRMALTAEAPALLEAMGAGPAEREVVEALETPQSPRRVCALVDVGDFRACRILWALRLVGAIESRVEEADFPATEDMEFVNAIGGDGGLDDDALAAAAAAIVAPGSAPLPAADPAAAGEPPWRATEPRGVAPEGGFDPAGTISVDTEEIRQALRELPESLIDGASDDADGEPDEPEMIDLDVDAPPAEDDWILPETAARTVDAFNAMHRLVWRALRAEIGAGATNFVRSCCGEAVEGDDPLGEVALNTDGSWDADGLRAALRARRIEDPWPLYEVVLEREFVHLAPVIGDRRANELKQQIWEIRRSSS